MHACRCADEVGIGNSQPMLHITVGDRSMCKHHKDLFEVDGEVVNEHLVACQLTTHFEDIPRALKSLCLAEKGEVAM